MQANPIRRMRRLAGVPAVAAVLTLALPATGDAPAEPVADLAAPSLLEQAALRPLTFPGRDRETRYTWHRDPASGATWLRATSDCAASALVRDLEGIAPHGRSRLSWRWKVDLAPDGPDERERDGDDFAARVYALFRFEPEHASWWQRVQRRVGRALFDTPMPGMAIGYVWARRAEAGQSWANPYQDDARIVVLRSGGPGDWQHESVDLVADFERLFDRPAPELIGIALMSDSDDTCQRAAARFADLRLEPAPEPAAERAEGAAP